MKQPVLLKHLSNEADCKRMVDTASVCPICGVNISPEVLYAISTYYLNGIWSCTERAFLLNLCPNCKECFISCHKANPYKDFSFEYAAPRQYSDVEFSENLQNLSPDFVLLYNEAAHAEAIGLTGICGMGYRKALEFLVKDFAIFNHPENENEIRCPKFSLDNCINKYLDNPQLENLAKASSWLGNDETHYTRRHAEHDVNDLKKFIITLVKYIDNELICREAQMLVSSADTKKKQSPLSDTD